MADPSLLRTILIDTHLNPHTIDSMTDTLTPPAATPAVSDTHTIQLPQASLKYLRDITNSVSWADDLSKMRHGGSAFELMPEPATEPVAGEFAASKDLEGYRAAVKEWAGTPAPAFVLTPRQFKAVKACVTFYSKKATLPPGRYTNALLDVFGLKAKDDEDDE